MDKTKVQNETKQCQSCKKDFIIEPEDFSFYEKIKVPPPTFCPECRLMRRLAYREDRPLYKSVCNLCKKDVISRFHPQSGFNGFCKDCWWSDKWDGLEYGQDYSFSELFFSQYYKLKRKSPSQVRADENCTDCKYSNGNIRCKNCTLCFDGYQAINCYNCHSPALSRDSVDSDLIINVDHAYESLNCNGLYNVRFAYFSDECFDSTFLFNCVGCSNCFGCVNLRNQKYCIFNKKYLKTEYEEKIKNYDLSSYKTLKEGQKKFWKLYLNTPRRFALITNSHNVVGDDIINTKNCQNCFSTRLGVENCKYILLSGLLLKDTYDMTIGGGNSELCYETSGGMKTQNCHFARGCHESSNIEYSEIMYNCSECFGCYGLRNKKYCIFNRQYTKGAYKELREKIIKHMNDMPYIDKLGRIYKYGEFFPSDFSAFGYNESMGQVHLPLTKKEALAKGFNWRDPEERDYNINIKFRGLPDDIREVTDNILTKSIQCEHFSQDCNHGCTKVFRILKNELNFLRSMDLTLPRLCPNCRYRSRAEVKNPPKLWHRKCMCNGVKSEDGVYKNTVEHFHKDALCENEFETAISPDRKEIVYCEKCYQAEFV